MATILYVLPQLPPDPFVCAASAYSVDAHNYFLLAGKRHKRRVLITDLLPAPELFRL